MCCIKSDFSVTKNVLHPIFLFIIINLAFRQISILTRKHYISTNLTSHLYSNLWEFSNNLFTSHGGPCFSITTQTSLYHETVLSPQKAEDWQTLDNCMVQGCTLILYHFHIFIMHKILIIYHTKYQILKTALYSLILECLIGAVTCHLVTQGYQAKIHSFLIGFPNSNFNFYHNHKKVFLPWQDVDEGEEQEKKWVDTHCQMTGSGRGVGYITVRLRRREGRRVRWEGLAFQVCGM